MEIDSYSDEVICRENLWKAYPDFGSFNDKGRVVIFNNSTSNDFASLEMKTQEEFDRNAFENHRAWKALLYREKTLVQKVETGGLIHKDTIVHFLLVDVFPKEENAYPIRIDESVFYHGNRKTPQRASIDDVILHAELYHGEEKVKLCSTCTGKHNQVLKVRNAKCISQGVKVDLSVTCNGAPKKSNVLQVKFTLVSQDDTLIWEGFSIPFKVYHNRNTHRYVLGKEPSSPKEVHKKSPTEDMIIETNSQNEEAILFHFINGALEAACSLNTLPYFHEKFCSFDVDVGRKSSLELFCFTKRTLWQSLGNAYNSYFREFCYVGDRTDALVSIIQRVEGDWVKSLGNFPPQSTFVGGEFTETIRIKDGKIIWINTMSSFDGEFGKDFIKWKSEIVKHPCKQ